MGKAKGERDQFSSEVCVCVCGQDWGSVLSGPASGFLGRAAVWASPGGHLPGQSQRVLPPTGSEAERGQVRWTIWARMWTSQQQPAGAEGNESAAAVSSFLER